MNWPHCWLADVTLKLNISSSLCQRERVVCWLVKQAVWPLGQILDQAAQADTIWNTTNACLGDGSLTLLDQWGGQPTGLHPCGNGMVVFTGAGKGGCGEVAPKCLASATVVVIYVLTDPVILIGVSHAGDKSVVLCCATD